ncbi:MAG: c(7)-type cytochrome triheme domain-containing protein [Nitrospirota bacterium]
MNFRVKQYITGMGFIFILVIFILNSCTIISYRPKSYKNKSSSLIAFQYLPKTEKNYVDWVAAVNNNIITPKESIYNNLKKKKPLNLNILFKIRDNFPIPDVVFPHYPHTLWLDCKNCHPGIFNMKAGSNPISMTRILNGEFCGRCHGKVAFTLSDCFRCHSKQRLAQLQK